MPSFTPEQMALEYLAERCLDEANQSFEVNEGMLFAAIMQAESFDDARVRLLALYPRLSVAVLEDVLGRGLLAASVFGLAKVQEELQAAGQETVITDMAAAEIRLEPLPMEAAIEFWRDKVQLSPGQFNKLADEAKTRAFAVSGIAKGQELETVYQALEKAISKGTTLAEFKRDCAEIFDKRGWVGKRAWRVDNIFRTNIQTAYNAGRYKKQIEQAAVFPYLQYMAVNDRRTRPTHLAMDDLVYPVGHPVWDTWYPPNGCRCRCSTRQLTARQVERRGLKVEEHDPTGSLMEPIDPRTGNRLPARLLIPDQGFATHPGKSAWGGIVDEAAGKGSGSFKTMPGQRGPADYRRPALRNVRPADIPDFELEQPLPKGLGEAAYKEAFLQQYGENKAVVDVLGEPVLLTLRVFQRDKRKPEGEDLKITKKGHGEIVPLVEKLLQDPFEVWLTPQKNRLGRIRLTKRYISLWKTANKERVSGLTVFEVVGGVFKGVTAFIPLDEEGEHNLRYAEEQREGLLLYSRKKG